MAHLEYSHYFHAFNGQYKWSLLSSGVKLAESGVTKHLTTPDTAGDKRVAVLCALKIRI